MTTTGSLPKDQSWNGINRLGDLSVMEDLSRCLVPVARDVIQIKLAIQTDLHIRMHMYRLRYIHYGPERVLHTSDVAIVDKIIGIGDHSCSTEGGAI
jgi:hypothetical protein